MALLSRYEPISYTAVQIQPNVMLLYRVVQTISGGLVFGDQVEVRILQKKISY